MEWKTFICTISIKPSIQHQFDHYPPQSTLTDCSKAGTKYGQTETATATNSNSTLSVPKATHINAWRTRTHIIPPHIAAFVHMLPSQMPLFSFIDKPSAGVVCSHVAHHHHRHRHNWIGHAYIAEQRTRWLKSKTTYTTLYSVNIHTSRFGCESARCVRSIGGTFEQNRLSCRFYQFLYKCQALCICIRRSILLW